MDPDDKQSNGQFDASLPLPAEARANLPAKHAPKEESGAAVELVRKKVQAAYGHEPDAEGEIEEVEDLKKSAHRSRHQQFIYELTSSGRPLHEVQTAWHEYYAGLPDKDKHEVWQEFYQTHAKNSQFHQAVTQKDKSRLAEKAITRPARRSHTTRRAGSTVARAIDNIGAVVPKNSRQYIKSLSFGLSVGAIVLLVFLLSFFNERIIAPFIQPSRNVTGTPIISGATIGPNPEVIIPKINVEIPVVYDVNTIDETSIDNALEQGVVHYADTALPGQDGNVAIVGHSSNNIFNKGKYKFAFVLLSRLETGDTFYLQKDGQRYTYQVYQKTIVGPSDVSVLGPKDKPATATLITCDPPGTSINRLVVVGEQISPDPVANKPQATNYALAETSRIIPGNSPTLWSRLVKWFEQ